MRRKNCGWSESADPPAFQWRGQTNGGRWQAVRPPASGLRPRLPATGAIRRPASSTTCPKVQTTDSASRPPRLWCRSDTGYAVARRPAAAIWQRGQSKRGSCPTLHSQTARSRRRAWMPAPVVRMRDRAPSHVHRSNNLGHSFVRGLPFAKPRQMIIVARGV